MPDSERTALRRRLRGARRALSGAQRRRADEALGRRLMRAPWLRCTGRIAAYLAADGEPDLAAFLRGLTTRGHKLYLPVLAPGGGMRFARFRSADQLAPNRYGMPEPVVAGRDLLPAQALSLILVPLVGFDNRGNRLGMGAGYYDRALRCRLHSPRARPMLVGVAYECQRVDVLSAQPWDVPLDAVVTEAQTYRFKLPRQAVA